MKIKYETYGGCFCKTPCPYGFTNGFTGEVKKVGSNGCADCRYFKNIDIENNEVDCFYQEHETAIFMQNYWNEHQGRD